MWKSFLDFIYGREYCQYCGKLLKKDESHYNAEWELWMCTADAKLIMRVVRGRS